MCYTLTMSSASIITRACRAAAAVSLMAMSVACSPSLGRREGAPAATASPRETRTQSIDHLTPRPDAVGSVPARFAWTLVDGADTYFLGIWNEVDTLIWRAGDLRAPSLMLPADFRLEPETYFWSVTAMRGDRPLAESGRAAFVVR